MEEKVVSKGCFVSSLVCRLLKCEKPVDSLQTEGVFMKIAFSLFVFLLISFYSISQNICEKYTQNLIGKDSFYDYYNIGKDKHIDTLLAIIDNSSQIYKAFYDFNYCFSNGIIKYYNSARKADKCIENDTMDYYIYAFQPGKQTVTKFYTPSCELVAEGVWYYQGFNGFYRDYYDNGNIKSEGSFSSNDYKDGIWKYYDKFGNEIRIEEWDVARLISIKKVDSNTACIDTIIAVVPNTNNINEIIHKHGNYCYFNNQLHFYKSRKKAQRKCKRYNDLDSVVQRICAYNTVFIFYSKNGEKLVEGNWYFNYFNGFYKDYYKNGH